MNKKELDWKNLSFAYIPIDFRFVSVTENGKWGKGKLIKDADIKISESAGIFQYAQQCFEGLKAFTAKDGSIVVFRPDLNAERLQQSCRQLMIPEVPVQMFLDAVDKVVAANATWIPPYGTGAALYVRPFVMGISPVLGVAPAAEYMFRVYASPVGPYYKGGFTAVRLMVSNFDRAAPKGTGHVKAGLNYAMSMYAGDIAKKQGFDDCLFLDPAQRKYIEETKGANIIFVASNKIVTPKSDSILQSITRRSLLEIAKSLGLECEERRISIDEIGNFSECGLCGTAAVISPVKSITYNGEVTEFTGMGPTLKKLYDTLIDIQTKAKEAPKGWVHTIEL